MWSVHVHVHVQLLDLHGNLGRLGARILETADAHEEEVALAVQRAGQLAEADDADVLDVHARLLLHLAHAAIRKLLSRIHCERTVKRAA